MESWQDKKLIHNPKARGWHYRTKIWDYRIRLWFTLWEEREQRNVSKSTTAKKLRVFLSVTKTP